MSSHFPPTSEASGASNAEDIGALMTPDPSPLTALFENLARWNAFCLREGMPDNAVIQIVTADGSIYPERECVDAPGGPCGFCRALDITTDTITPLVVTDDGDSLPLSDIAMDVAEVAPEDCIDCQSSVLQNALADSEVAACICEPAENVDCSPYCLVC